jgi:hypothetical protein
VKKLSPRAKSLPVYRAGDVLKIGRETILYGRNILLQTNSGFEVQHRLFVVDPWAMIAEGIHRALRPGRSRDIAHSFRRQAEDYFGAATIGREPSVRPVLLYYAFLNLSKAFAVARGNTHLEGRAYHGISSTSHPKDIARSLIRFETSSPGRPGIFQTLFQQLDGNASVTASNLRLRYVLPQILPGHRLWCYATKKLERFVSIEHFQIRHSAPSKEIWLNVILNKNDLDQLGMSEQRVLIQSGLAGEFEAVSLGELIRFQQTSTERYSIDPGEALTRILRKVRNSIWETVKIVSPYRKSYLYCCPPSEQSARVPQMISIYVFMFFLGSITRYFPLHFEDILNSKYGPFVETFISESPTQFLYLMASEVLGREVSKPAIV